MDIVKKIQDASFDSNIKCPKAMVNCMTCVSLFIFLFTASNGAEQLQVRALGTSDLPAGNTSNTINTTSTSTNIGNSNQSASLTYENSTLGISLQYPSDWVYRYPPNASGIVFIPQKAILEKSKAGFTVVFQDLPIHNMSLDLITQLNINELKKSHPDFNLLESKRITLTHNNITSQ